MVDTKQRSDAIERNIPKTDVIFRDTLTRAERADKEEVAELAELFGSFSSWASAFDDRVLMKTTRDRLRTRIIEYCLKLTGE